MKQFIQEFLLYRIINQDLAIMRNAYMRMALALSFMRGPRGTGKRKKTPRVIFFKLAFQTGLTAHVALHLEKVPPPYNMPLNLVLKLPPFV
jgi:hypothetical protein